MWIESLFKMFVYESLADLILQSTHVGLEDSYHEGGGKV